MSIATAAPPAQATASGLLDRVLAVIAFLEEHNVERKPEIELLLLSILAQLDLLFLGEPGVGKTYLLEMFTQHCLVDAKLYDYMVFSQSGLNEVLGPPSVAGMKEDEVRRVIEGFLPTAHTAIIDEVFKGSPGLLNALLSILASRNLKIGGKLVDCSQLITVLMASNELPTSEELWPFRDRIDVTKVVEPVRTAEGRKRVREIQLGQMAGGVVFKGQPLTLDEMAEARVEVAQVELPEPVGKALDKCQEEWLKAKHAPSQRRMKSIYRMVKAHAWLRGATVATSDDLLPVQHMAWNHQEDADSARKVIMKHAGQFTRKVNSLKTELDPRLVSMDEARTKHTEATDASDRRDAFNSMFDAQRELASLEGEAKKLRDTGVQSGQDTTDLDGMLEEIGKARDYARRLLMAEEETTT